VSKRQDIDEFAAFLPLLIANGRPNNPLQHETHAFLKATAP